MAVAATMRTTQSVKGMLWIARVRAKHMPEKPDTLFLAAFDKYADALFRYACMRLSNRDRATDLTQDTFIKVWDHICAGNDISNWKAFLYRVLNNLIIDEYRRSKSDSLDTLLESDFGSGNVLLSVGSRREKEETLDDELLIEKVRALIPKLPENYRLALSLRYVDNLTPKEVAHVLGISENSASVRIHRAVARLRELCIHL